jgi:hypothetical protein
VGVVAGAVGAPWYVLAAAGSTTAADVSAAPPKQLRVVGVYDLVDPHEDYWAAARWSTCRAARTAN